MDHEMTTHELKSTEPFVDPRLEQDRAAPDPDAPSEAGLDAMFARVAAETLDRPRTVRSRLSELPTPLRVALATLAGLGVAAGVLVAAGVRPDATPDGAMRFLATMSCLVALVGLAVALSLRGPHRRPATRMAWTVTALALAAPFALAFVPWLWTGDSSALVATTGPGLGCLAVALVTAALVGLVVRVFQRDDGGADWRLSTLAGAGGLVAFMTVQLHCPADGLMHLLIGHGLAGVILALVLLVAARLPARGGA